MKITKDTFVSIHYTLTDKDGVELDSSRDTEPLGYLHGVGYLIPGLERELEGKEAGDKLNVVVQPEDAYGERNEEWVVQVDRSQFDTDVPIQVGMQFEAGGGRVVTVTAVADDEITIDANHPMAGKELHFDVEVIDVREATPDELAAIQSSCSCGGGCGGCGGNCGDGECNCGSDGGCGGSCGGGCGNCQ